MTALRADEYAVRTRAGKKNYSYESELSKQEHKATGVFRKLVAFATIDATDKSALADYIFLTLKRLTNRDNEMRATVREALAKLVTEHSSEVFRLALSSDFARANKLEKELQHWQSKDAETLFLRESMIGQVGLVHRALVAKSWSLVKAGPEEFFVTTDNPVVFDRSFGVERGPLLFPLTQKLLLVANGADVKDLTYRDSSPHETRTLNAMIITCATREVYSPRPDEWIQKGWSGGFVFYS